jgi:hypothetical protein
MLLMMGAKEHPKYVERSCSEIKYRLLNAASHWKLIYIKLKLQCCSSGQRTEKLG